MQVAAAASSRDVVLPIVVSCTAFPVSLRATEGVGSVDSLPPLGGHIGAHGRAVECAPCVHVLAVRSARVRTDTTDTVFKLYRYETGIW